MQNSKYDPATVAQFSKVDVQNNFQGEQFTPTKGESTNCDFKITDDHMIDGARLVTSGVTDGDTLDAKVVDVDNILGYGAGTVLKTFVTAWPIPSGSSAWDYASIYPAKIPHGLYIRIVYNSVAGIVDPQPKMKVGYRLHKILW